MFLIKKNKKLKIKDKAVLKNDKNLLNIWDCFMDKKNGVLLTNKMLSIKEIKLQNDILIGDNKPFFYDEWWWYPWMFQNIQTKQLKIE